MRTFIAALGIVLAGAAMAQIGPSLNPMFTPPVGPGSILPIGPSMPSNNSGGGGGGCNGVIDLSKGCVLGAVP